MSADLAALGRLGVLVVCSGVKSILDIGATLEVLETGSVPVLGYRTDAFPGFYRRDSGHPVPWRVDEPAQVAAVWRAHRALGAPSGLVLAQPVPAADELDATLHDRLLAEGLALVAERGGGARTSPRRCWSTSTPGAAGRASPRTWRWSG